MSNSISTTSIFIGSISLMQSLNYPVGSLYSMGPGWWPMLISVLLIFGGVVMLIISKNTLVASRSFPVIAILKISVWVAIAIVLLTIY